MVGHCAVRWWAMGKRSLEQKIAGEDDIRRMREIVREAIRGGALGFSTSRTLLHKTPDGEPVPGTFAGPDELIGIGNVLGEEGRGVFEAVPYLDSTESDVIVGEVDWMERVSRANGRPLTFGMLQTRQFPDLWRTVLDSVEKANARGAQILPQTQVRSVGVLFGLVNLTPWDLAGGTWGLLKLISLEERLAAFRAPEKRAKLIEDSKKSPMGDVAAQVTSTCSPSATAPPGTTWRPRTASPRSRPGAASRPSKPSWTSRSRPTARRSSPSRSRTRISTWWARCSRTRTWCSAWRTRAPTAARSWTPACRPSS